MEHFPLVTDEPRCRIAVHVVTWNSARTIVPCLQSVLAQGAFLGDDELMVTVTDNASSDDTRARIRETFGDQVMLHENERNVGFSEAHNVGIGRALRARAEFILVLNPDLRLEPDALSHLVKALRRDERAGSATPKLFRAQDRLAPVEPRRLDAAGMFMTPEFRHFDRGSELPDDGTVDAPSYVFGGTGAALLLRAAFVHDAALRSAAERPELFDEAFFAYREDADLAWRGLLLGWRCRYVPEAVGYHLRTVLPERRSSLPEELNALSVRNRFLLQLNNLSIGLLLRFFIPLTSRNMLVIGAVLIRERSSLPALFEAIRLAPRALRHRKELMSRRRIRGSELSRWFRFHPVVEPALSLRECSDKVRSIAVIIVNFNSGGRLVSALRAVIRSRAELMTENLEVKIIVVDNSSTDGSAKGAHKYFCAHPDVRFEFFPRNLGFAGAVNAALLCEEADAFLILNPDVEIHAEAFHALVSALNAHDNLGAVGPVYLSEEGVIQRGYTARAFPTLGSTLAELFFLHRLFPGNPWTSHYRRSGDPFLWGYIERRTKEDGPRESLDLPCVVEQPAAACLLIRGTLFRALSGFDPAFSPAWFEDVDLCKRLREFGAVAAVESRAQVRHSGGYSLTTLSQVEFAEAWFPNLCVYWQKHGTPFERGILSILLPVALLLRSVLTAVESLLAWRRHESVEEHVELSRSLRRLAFRVWKSAACRRKAIAVERSHGAPGGFSPT